MCYRNKFLKILFTTINFLLVFILAAEGSIIVRKARNTLTPIEMNIGDTLKFTLHNGQTRTMVLLETGTAVIITNLNKLQTDQPGGATLYDFNCKVSFDGHPMLMERYVGSQESFYEPYVINGMRIWFDGVAKMTDVIKDEHGGVISESKPDKDARFAVNDQLDNICPFNLFPICPIEGNRINIEDCYNGDDCWMGAYNGFEAHGGLDINQPAGTPNYAPFQIEDHYLFNSLSNGDNNNRWKGMHKWDNGDIWFIQNHHLTNLLIAEHQPIHAGTQYAEAAGVHNGTTEHAHYVFRIKSAENEKEILLDPWIIFWQVFEDKKRRNKEIKAYISGLEPGKTNIPVQFYSKGSTNASEDQKLSYYWTFGDGGFSTEENPAYTFVKAGIFPVTLVTDNGMQKATFTQHITIDGENLNEPTLTLTSEDEPSFRNRPLHIMDVYGNIVKNIPHSLFFLARSTRPIPDKKIIILKNTGGGALPRLLPPEISYSKGNGWITLKTLGEKNSQKLEVSVNAEGLSTGRYTATVQLECPGASNSRQDFIVELIIPTFPPSNIETNDLEAEIIDNEDNHYCRFYSTPYFWVGPRFKRWKEKGYGNYYLTNGARAVKGEYARFRPDLEAGRYDIYFANETPFSPQKRAMKGLEKLSVNNFFNPSPRFALRVHSKTGDNKIWVEPAKSTKIGTFEFSEGMDGYVDILSEGSTGQVLVDAIIFKKVQK
jgi:PKD repeat protein